MAFLAQSELDKEKEKSGNPATSENVISTESGTISGAGGASSKPAQSSKPTSSGSYTNLLKYVDANKGNDAQIGQRVTQVVDNSAQKATGSVGNYQSTGQKAVDAGTVKDNGLIGAVKNAPTTVNKDQFQNQYNATYKGPEDYTRVDGYDQATADTNKVSDQVKSASGGLSERTSLLTDAYSNPGYKAGEQRFDSFLLGAGDAGKSALKDVQQNYADFGKGLTEAQGKLTDSIASGKSITDATRASTQNAYNSSLDASRQTINNVQDQVNKSNADNATKYQNVVSGISSSNPTVRAAALKEIGLTLEQGDWLRSRGYDASQIIQQSKAQNLGDVVKDSQANNYLALRALLDQGSEFDFTKAGGSSTAFTTRQDQIDATKQAASLESQLNSQLNTAQAARDREWTELQAALFNPYLPDYDKNQALNKLGISRSDYDLAINNGISLKDFLKAGTKKLGVGDVTSAADRQKYSALLGALGIQGINTAANSPDAAYSFDKASWEQLLAPLKATPVAPPPVAEQPLGPVKPGGETPAPADTFTDYAVKKGEQLGDYIDKRLPIRKVRF